MTMVKFELDLDNPPKLSAETIARLDAMTASEVEANAAADPDNPPLTDDELDLMVGARAARAARSATGLSQVRFAEAFHINVARLRDLEQGRFQKPDSALVAYLKVISREPDVVRQALNADAKGRRA